MNESLHTPETDPKTPQAPETIQQPPVSETSETTEQPSLAMARKSTRSRLVGGGWAKYF